LSQQEASAFAENNARAMSGGDVNALTTYYANQVDYLDEGFVSSDVIRRGLEQYFARWPQTSWEVSGAVTVQSLTPSRYQITFPVSFEAVNPATHKRSAGVARETIVLERDDTGAWKIVRQRETVTSNKADDRRRWPERKKVYRGQPVEDNRPRVPLPPNIPWPSGLPRP
jgi:ketosteroid isomerase-like protein